MLKKVLKDIRKYKNKLSVLPVTENFGQKEVRALRDKYDYITLSSVNVDERNKIFTAIESFEEWCYVHC